MSLKGGKNIYLHYCSCFSNGFGSMEVSHDAEDTKAKGKQNYMSLDKLLEMLPDWAMFPIWADWKVCTVCIRYCICSIVLVYCSQLQIFRAVLLRPSHIACARYKLSSLAIW